MTTFSNHKLAIDLLISISATFILSASILSISTNNWNIKREDSITNRTGLFQQCSNTFCCDAKELDRSVTLFSLLSIILLIISTLSSFLFMATRMNYKNRCYILVPLTLFGAGISMTLTLIQILDRLYLNGYSAFLFIIDTILAYFLGGISLLHANMFYF
jgi:glucose uptake protein GlcU